MVFRAGCGTIKGAFKVNNCMSFFSARFDIRTLHRQRKVEEVRKILPTCTASDMKQMLKQVFSIQNFQDGQREVVHYISRHPKHRESCMLVPDFLFGPSAPDYQLKSMSTLNSPILDLLLSQMHIHHHPLTSAEVLRKIMRTATQKPLEAIDLLVSHPSIKHYNRFQGTPLLSVCELHADEGLEASRHCWETCRSTLRPDEWVTVLHLIEEERWAVRHLKGAFRPMQHWLDAFEEKPLAWKDRCVRLWDEYAKQDPQNRSQEVLPEWHHCLERYVLTQATNPSTKPSMPQRKI